MLVKNTLLILVGFLFVGCAPDSITPISNVNKAHYSGKTKVLIAVTGDDERAVRHIEIYTAEEPLGYEIYFHDNKVSHGFIAITLPTPSSDVRIKEYSLTGHYGCSRGKAGYGSGSKTIAHITDNHTYFLGTIDTGMNTSYNEMPTSLIKEAKTKHNYIPHGTDLVNKEAFRNHITL